MNVDVAAGWSHRAENGNIDKTSEIFMKRQSLSYIASMMHESMYIKQNTDRGNRARVRRKPLPKPRFLSRSPNEFA